MFNSPTLLKGDSSTNKSIYVTLHIIQIKIPGMLVVINYTGAEHAVTYRHKRTCADSGVTFKALRVETFKKRSGIINTNLNHLRDFRRVSR